VSGGILPFLHFLQVEPAVKCATVTAMAEVYHHTIFFSGRVQGVGFRYATAQVAREFEVAGFVQNLPDGRVRLEAEGGEGELEQFAAAVEERMHGFIRKAERLAARRAPQFSGFSIQ
jgi:acylphosphatase